MSIGFLQKNRVTIIVVPIILFLILYWSWIFLSAGDFFISHKGNENSRQALLKIRESIKVGDSYENVLQTYWETDSTKLGLSIISENKNEWIIIMKPEFLETDWRLFIFFQDGKVIGHQVRTSDGPPPPDAPKSVGVIK